MSSQSKASSSASLRCRSSKRSRTACVTGSCPWIWRRSATASKSCPGSIRRGVQRRWPDGLRVEITEQVAAARWGDAGLLNTRGELFLAQRAPRAAGAAAAHRTHGQRSRRSRSATCPRRGAARMRSASRSVRLDERGAWELELATACSVRLGRRQVDDRFDRFIRQPCPTVAGRAEEITYVDMRYTNGFASAGSAAASQKPTSSPNPGRPHLRPTSPHEETDCRCPESSERNLIVGLDIGTSKVVAIVGEMATDGSDRGHRHRLASFARPEEGRGRQHRIDRAVDPARGRGSRADGRLRDPLGVRRHRRQPRAQPELARHRRDPRQGSDRRRRRSRDRRGAGRGDPGRPEDPARPAAGIHHRQPGRHPRADRHVRRAPRGQGAHRHRRGQRRAEHRQVRAALRPGGRGHRARAAGLELRGADRRREGARRVPGRHRRRHDRHRGVLGRRDPPHGRDPDRRRPGHQRHRGDAAHADAVRRGNQDQLRLRAVAARESRRDHRGAERRAIGRRDASRARRSPRSSSRATRSSSAWCARSCGAPASRK